MKQTGPLLETNRSTKLETRSTKLETRQLATKSRETGRAHGLLGYIGLQRKWGKAQTGSRVKPSPSLLHRK